MHSAPDSGCFPKRFAEQLNAVEKKTRQHCQALPNFCSRKMQYTGSPMIRKFVLFLSHTFWSAVQKATSPEHLCEVYARLTALSPLYLTGEQWFFRTIICRHRGMQWGQGRC